MNYNYSNRGYLLPHGCKDLIDAIGQEVGDSLVIKVRVPDATLADLVITVEGKSIRISGGQSTNQNAFESIYEVPVGYNIGEARASYLNGELRIAIPRAA